MIDNTTDLKQNLEKEWLTWKSTLDVIKLKLHFGDIQNQKVMQHIISGIQKELKDAKKSIASLVELADNEKEKNEIIDSFKRIKDAIDKSQHYY